MTTLEWTPGLFDALRAARKALRKVEISAITPHWFSPKGRREICAKLNREHLLAACQNINDKALARARLTFEGVNVTVVPAGRGPIFDYRLAEAAVDDLERLHIEGAIELIEGDIRDVSAVAAVQRHGVSTYRACDCTERYGEEVEARLVRPSRRLLRAEQLERAAARIERRAGIYRRASAALAGASSATHTAAALAGAWGDVAAEKRRVAARLRELAAANGRTS